MSWASKLTHHHKWRVNWKNGEMNCPCGFCWKEWIKIVEYYDSYFAETQEGLPNV